MVSALLNQNLVTSPSGTIGNPAPEPDEMCLFCLFPRWTYPDGACCSWNRADGTPKNSPPVYQTKEITVAKETVKDSAAVVVENVGTVAAAAADSLGLKSAVWIVAGFVGLALAWKIKEF